MRHKVAFYIGFITTSALVCSAVVWRLTPETEPRGLAAAICFAVLGILAQALGHKLGGNASGNISFIPFLASAILAPNILTVAAVATSVLVIELSVKRAIPKGLFNIAQYVLAIALGITLFRFVGGVSFLANPSLAINPLNEPLAAIAPVVALVVFFLGVNTGAVSGAISISESLSFAGVWRRTGVTALLYDVLSVPFVLLFVAVYTLWGPTGAVLLAAPLLGVRQIYKTNRQLEQTNHELLQLMVAAIEARDPYTSGHSRRVSRSARIIASVMGLGAKQVEKVTTAALLHDVGKIHEVFAPILQKPGKLTADERRIMETHSALSAELISNVSYLHDIVDQVLHHHENWDGSGYPHGLKDNAIPLGSRIIMVADTIDAMTSDRPYRKALGEAEVRKELIKFRGRQFDPEICDVLLISPRFHELFEGNSEAHVDATERPLLRKWRMLAANF